MYRYTNLVAYLRSFSFCERDITPKIGDILNVNMELPISWKKGDIFSVTSGENNHEFSGKFFTMKLLEIVESHNYSVKLKVKIEMLGDRLTYVKPVSEIEKLKLRRGKVYNYGGHTGCDCLPEYGYISESVTHFHSTQGEGYIHLDDYIFTDNDGIDHLVQSSIEYGDVRKTRIGDMVLGYHQFSPFFSPPETMPDGSLAPKVPHMFLSKIEDIVRQEGGMVSFLQKAIEAVISGEGIITFDTYYGLYTNLIIYYIGKISIEGFLYVIIKVIEKSEEPDVSLNNHNIKVLFNLLAKELNKRGDKKWPMERYLAFFYPPAKETTKKEEFHEGIDCHLTFSADGKTVTGVKDETIPCITIPKGVEHIGMFAFSGCSRLESIVIPDSVKSIGWRAFWGCSNLTSVTLPDSVTSIGERAFDGCSNLTSINIPDSVTSMGKRVFTSCSKLELTTISYPSKLRKIIFYYLKFSDDGKMVTGYKLPFSDAKTFKTVIIPDGVTSIGDCAFKNCFWMTTVIIPDSVVSIGESAFEHCSKLTSVTIPDSVASIRESAFGDCYGLNQVNVRVADYAALCNNNIIKKIKEHINKPVTLIDKNGKEIHSITIPGNMTNVGDYSFYYCIGLTSVTLGNGVISIGNGAFYGCSGLTSIDIPDSVASIGYLAFLNCKSLTSIDIPDSVSSIGEGAFRGCSGLTSINVDVENSYYDSRDNCNAIIETSSNTLLFGFKNSTILDSVTSIGDYAFRGCSDLVAINIPDSVTNIGVGAFEGCSSLKNIIIPDSVRNIGSNVFNGCCKLTSVTIPDNVTSVGDDAFRGCSGLKSISFPGSMLKIESGTFSDCTSLTHLIIPEGITVIGEYAFGGCSGLTSITIPGSVERLEENSFEGCSGLVSISVSSNNPFYDSRNNCNAIIETATNTLLLGCSKTTIPDNIKSIGDNAFSECTSLTNLIIPEGITSIGNGAFYGCSGLTSIHIPEGVTTIEEGTFMGCSSLTTIVLPSSVKSIEYEAFYECENLTSINIPDSVTSIGEEVFYMCSSLEEIHVLSKRPSCITVDNSSYNAFSDETLKQCTLYVPKGTSGNYRSHPVFGKFERIVEEDENENN